MRMTMSIIDAHGSERRMSRKPAIAGQVDEPRLPDYSRQMALKEVGPAGQAKLRASRVLVIGCGGLGVPVLKYLAGAGVGRIGLVDGDKLEASNLHRQTMYALADVGEYKAVLAAERLRALNPEVDARAYTVRLTAENASELVGEYDLVIDCTDNFSTKFLLNDVCVRLRKPVIFSSVYQYEGQLQVVRPDRNGACLRCVWPEATRDGLVGNCAEAGVLGPVPGVFGSLQALEALKTLLDLPGQLGDELLVLDLLTMSTSRVRIRRAASCPDHASARVARSPPVSRSTAAQPSKSNSIRSTMPTRRSAGHRHPRSARAGRNAHARQALRATFRWPSSCTAAGQLAPTGKYLLVCASGRRSFAAAEELRSRGFGEVYSLRGGVSGARAALSDLRRRPLSQEPSIALRLEALHERSPSQLGTGFVRIAVSRATLTQPATRPLFDYASRASARRAARSTTSLRKQIAAFEAEMSRHPPPPTPTALKPSARSASRAITTISARHNPTRATTTPPSTPSRKRLPARRVTAHPRRAGLGAACTWAVSPTRGRRQAGTAIDGGQRRARQRAHAARLHRGALGRRGGAPARDGCHGDG